MIDKKLLLLFVRNPELGKVKTRLAAAVGPERALEIYLRLLHHTLDITRELPVQKLVYYSDHVDTNDLWPNEQYGKRLQPPGDLGEKMEAAFAAAFAEEYTSVIIIGSDCLQLTPNLQQQAYHELTQHDVVIGPALDGGYYLLGINKLYPELFRNKRWSTKDVFPDTLHDIQTLQLSCVLLPRLADVDYIEDLDATRLP